MASMISCGYAGNAAFAREFKARMLMMGIKVPTTGYETVVKVTAIAGAIVGVLDKLPASATVAELIGATTALEFIGVAAALSAAAFVGIFIGSLMVAATKTLGCGYDVNAVGSWLKKYGLEFEGWNAFYHHQPKIFGDLPLHLQPAYA